MVIIRATKGCQHHDSRLHIGKIFQNNFFLKRISLCSQQKSALEKMNVQEQLRETSVAISMWQELQLFSVHFFAPQSIIFHFRLYLRSFAPSYLVFYAGTRICVNCPKYSTNSIHHLPDPEVADENSIQETNCAELTQTPIRKFRLSSHCHGKLTFLAPNPTSTCSCSHGLHFRLIPENWIDIF